MAFNNLQPSSGPFFLAPGASIGITMWYGDPGDDHGAQWIMAHPILGEPPNSTSSIKLQKDFGLFNRYDNRKWVCALFLRCK